MKNLLVWLCVLGLCSSVALPAQKYTISGYLTDAETGEKLIAANVFELRSAQGAVTNNYGFFSLTLPADSVYLQASYIGYENRTVALNLTQDIPLDFSLSSSLTLDVVTVTAEQALEENSQMSQVEVPVEQIKKLPALLGEVDVLKTLQLLPGVQSGGEGQSGLYVRGGSPDQNLVLLDGVPVYNVSHVLGIFSVFNADAIKNVTLTKGGFPARYGGRLSSVLEINMKDGNLKEFHGEGAVGIISSKLTLEGPIKTDQTSFIISGRRTYADLVARPFVKAAAKRDEQQIGFDLSFFDLNAKLNHRINDQHRLYLSGYWGGDVFGTDITDQGDRFGGGIDWGNLITAARWNWQLQPKLFANTTLTYSRYRVDISAFQETLIEGEAPEAFGANYFSGIEDIGGKIDFDFIPSPQHYIRFGAAATNHTYEPGALSITSTEIPDTLIGSQDSYSTEYALYIEDDMTFGQLKANVGIHFSAFDVEDELYTAVQPRLGLRYLLPNDWALKGSFSTMQQYINLLTSESLSLPTDLWVPSTARIRPQRAWQAAAGVAKTLDGGYELSAEAYYKEMTDVISFKEGASFLLGLENDWQDKVTQGDGEAYGLELFLQKKKGRTTGWVGYTLSWNNRQFDDINGGKVFPFRYDRRHDLSVVASHQLSERISVSGAFIYGTGNAISLNTYKWGTGPQGFYSDRLSGGGDKNSFRMSDYHRMDVSIEFFKQKKRYARKWIISVYNIYWNRNPYFVQQQNRFDRRTGDFTGTEFTEVSILPIIPSVAYSFKF